MHSIMKVRLGSVGALGMAIGAALVLMGCMGTEDSAATKSSSESVVLKVNTPADLAQESANDYNVNVNGIITGATLKRWKDDWVNERPAGITGKLVILQMTAGPAGSAYITSNDPNVVTYLTPSAEWSETRNNGVIWTRTMVLDGSSMDALLNKYAIDPTRDMVVCAQGAGSGLNSMYQGRCWYTLRYWGVDAKNIALLNGSNIWQRTNDSWVDADFAAAASTAPNNGKFSVRSLPVDNTALQATVGDLLAVLPSGDTNVKTDGVFIWDARSIGQFSAGLTLENNDAGYTDATICGAPAPAYCAPGGTYNRMSSFQNDNSRQGHPNGALQLQYTNMMVAGTGHWYYKPKADIQAYFDGGTDAAGRGFVDGTRNVLGTGNAYQEGDVIYTYCETTMRAMVTGVASAVILGKPTRFYDGAMVEWNSLSNIKAQDGNFIYASYIYSDSPWRTDNKSFFLANASANAVEPRFITGPYAEHTNAIVEADRAYKLPAPETTTTTGGGGGALPANPCGG